MTKFQNIINRVGAVIDYIPGLATLVNGSILIYQRAHRVDQAANPVNRSWKSDLKIYALSKDKVVAKASLTPFIGTIGAIITHSFRNSYFKLWKGFDYKINRCLIDAARVDPNKRNHSLELATLYLDRNPDLDPAELVFPLCQAAVNQNMPLIDLFLERMEPLSAETTVKVLSTYSVSGQVALRILNTDHEALSLRDKEEIIRGCTERETLFTLIPLFPEVREDIIRQKTREILRYSPTEEQLRLLLGRCGDMSDHELIEILRDVKPETWDLVFALTQCSPEVRLTTMGRHLNSETFPAYKAWVEENEAALTDEQKALVLKPIISYKPPEIIEFAHQFAERNRTLSAHAATEVLRDLIWSAHYALFAFYFNTFENLTADNVREFYTNRSFLPEFRELFLRKFPELAAD
ncbi:MAG: hypothetical protein ACK5MA_06805 [Parachlamydiaceae bacterium]